jgi:hypothetical protein|tara:strand:+ start:397 stop:570 length:174 start_codon:yes stop_codon:yes gene_type:complete
MTTTKTTTEEITTVLDKNIANCAYYNLIPMKLINAIPIKPVIIKVIPRPRKGAGTFE